MARGGLKAEVETVPAGVIVAELVRRIPAGRVATYGTVGRAATALGRPIGGARTVAWILAARRGADELPWQRVLGAGGRILLGDRRGALQRARLIGEGVDFVKGRVPARFILDVAELIVAPVRGRRRARRAAL